MYFYFKGYDLLCDQINELLDNKNQKIKNENFTKKDLNEDKNKDIPLEIFSSSNKYKNPKKKNNIFEKNLNIITSKDVLNNKKNISKKTKNEKHLEYIEYEIDNISYEKALENDKRTFFQYYISLLKVKHILILAFYKTKDYNSFIIKICLLIFSLASLLV